MSTRDQEFQKKVSGEINDFLAIKKALEAAGVTLPEEGQTIHLIDMIRDKIEGGPGSLASLSSQELARVVNATLPGLQSAWEETSRPIQSNIPTLPPSPVSILPRSTLPTPPTQLPAQPEQPQKPRVPDPTET